MEKLRNSEDIKKIIMKPVAYTKCVIGQDWYKNELTIVFYPDKVYPDYIDVNDWIMKHIDGQELNIETVVDKIYAMLEQEYQPKQIQIYNNIKGCKTHFDVVVIK